MTEPHRWKSESMVLAGSAPPKGCLLGPWMISLYCIFTWSPLCVCLGPDHLLEGHQSDGISWVHPYDLILT